MWNVIVVICNLIDNLVSKVLKGAQGFVVPNVSHGSTEMIFGTEEVFDEEEGEGAYAKNMARTLADWNVGDGAAIDVDDDVSELKLKVRLAPSLPPVGSIARMFPHRHHLPLHIGGCSHV